MAAPLNGSSSVRMGEPVPPNPGTEGAASLWDRIQSIAVTTLFYLAHVFFAICNPTLFYIGVVTGIIWGEGTDQAIEKISAVWKKHPILATVIPPYFTAAFLACGAIISGANLGRMLYVESTTK
jgi:hypothetical protein